jgi:prolyl-tRNA editing enzyme YbaK/EbsC (Cys-tRNA(Pro) deacylase)
VSTPDDLLHFIREHGIAAELIAPAMETPTVPAAAAALGVDARQIIKSMVFLVGDVPTLVVASGVAPVDRRALADRYQTGKKQIKLADAGTVLRLTGYPVGGVPPLGHLTPLPVLLDETIQEWSQVYGGGGDERTLLRIQPAELARVVQGEWIALNHSAKGT